VAEYSTILVYDVVSICNPTVPQVRLGDTTKEGKTRKQGQKLWEDRNRWKYVPHEAEIYKDLGGGGERQV
jgi:hypothetical protein